MLLDGYSEVSDRHIGLSFVDVAFVNVMIVYFPSYMHIALHNSGI